MHLNNRQLDMSKTSPFDSFSKVYRTAAANQLLEAYTINNKFKTKQYYKALDVYN